jgi:prevent-host-death family protein
MLGMEIGVRQLRAELSRWVAYARQGYEVVITDRGRPVARLTALPGADALTRLVDAGLLTGASRPKQTLDRPTVRPRASVSDLLIEQRDRDRG